MKNIESLWKTISDISKKNDLNNDVREEINIILETLKPIEKPEMLNVTGKNLLIFWKINFLSFFLISK